MSQPARHNVGFLFRSCLAAAALLIVGACGSDLRPVAEFVTPPGSLAPELNSGADGRAYLSWLQQQQDGHRLRYATLDGRGWSGPHTVAAGSDWLVSQMDWPGVTAIGGDAFTAYWQRRRGTSGYASEIQIAFSPDRGGTWSPAVPLHDDATDTEHGFVNLLPLGDRLHVIWLDGRETAAPAGAHDHSGATMLRHATFDTAGQRLAETIVDARACDCCHVAAAAVDGGFIIAYRDRSDSEIRDVVTRRYVNGNWVEAVPVHVDGWKLDGCPVNGPSIAARGATLAVAWFSGSDDEPKVLAAISRDGGAGFEPALRIDESRALGRVDIAALPDGDFVISWAELDGDAPVFKLRRLSPAAGAVAGSIRRLPAESPSGFPRMLAQGDGIVVAWTEGEGAAARVRAMEIRADDI